MTTTELTVTIAQASIANGAWRGDAPNQVAVREPKRADAPGAGKGDLFILAEIQGDLDNPAALERQVVECVRDNYYLARGSITASLRRAVQAGGDMLYHRNQKVSVDERVVGGVVAVVIQNDDAFVAQLGPTALFAVMGEHICRYPEQSMWLGDNITAADANADDILGMGLSSLSEPTLYHLKMESNDILLLTDSQLGGRMGLQSVVNTLNGQPLKTAVKTLGETTPVSHGSMLALSVSEVQAQSFGPLRVTPPGQWGKLFQQPDPGGTTGPPPEAQPSPPVVDESSRVMASTAPEAAYSPAVQSSQGRLETKRWDLMVGNGILAAVAVAGQALSNLTGMAGPSGDTPQRQAGMQANRTQPTRARWIMFRNVALVIPLIVIVIVGVNYLQRGRIQETEYQDLVANAQSKYEQAQVVDRTSAYALLNEANSLLIQAEAIQADQPEVIALRQQITNAIDQLGNMQRLSDLPKLRQYTDSGTQLADIVLEGTNLYVMDGGNGRVYRHRIDPQTQTLLPDDESLLVISQGQTVNDVQVGNLDAMIWMPVGGNRQTSDLLILGTTGLMEYNPNWGLTNIGLIGREAFVSPVAVSSFFGNFYVLDPGANRLWRYLPTPDGYTLPPEDYFAANQTADLSGAVDFAIDGNVYVLYRDGFIGKYAGGQPLEFATTGLDVPFSNPVALFTAPDEEVQHIYIADAGNQRIVQLEKDGTFVRQFKPRSAETATLSNLQDIQVDEISNKMYILDSNSLYVGNLPSE